MANLFPTIHHLVSVLEKFNMHDRTRKFTFNEQELPILTSKSLNTNNQDLVYITVLLTKSFP